MHKLTATKIEFRRAEGMTHECITRTFEGPDCWKRCEEHVMKERHTAPEEGGYDKCDVVITFEADDTGEPFSYKFRYDMTHPSVGGYDDTVAKHVRNSWAFYAGRWTPSHMTTERHQRFLKDMEIDPCLWGSFLDTYEVP